MIYDNLPFFNICCKFITMTCAGPMTEPILASRLYLTAPMPGVLIKALINDFLNKFLDASASSHSAVMPNRNLMFDNISY